MTESFIISIDSNCILKLFIIIESPVKDNITWNKTIFQTWENSLILMSHGLKSTNLILATGMNKHNIITKYAYKWHIEAF